jgi:hypothetical protein
MLPGEVVLPGVEVLFTLKGGGGGGGPEFGAEAVNVCVGETCERSVPIRC